MAQTLTIDRYRMFLAAKESKDVEHVCKILWPEAFRSVNDTHVEFGSMYAWGDNVYVVTRCGYIDGKWAYVLVNIGGSSGYGHDIDHWDTQKPRNKEDMESHLYSLIGEYGLEYIGRARDLLTTQALISYGQALIHGMHNSGKDLT